MSAGRISISGWAARTALLVGSIAAALLCAEIAVRATGLASAGFTDPIFQQSSAPGVVYELRPRVSGRTWGNTWVVTNALGLRGPEVEPRKAAGCVRIGVFGDSVTFGQGVTDDETYPRVLERLLRERHGGERRTFEVLNFGVPAYNIENIVSSFVEKGRGLEIDVAVLAPIVEDFGFHRRHTVDEAGYPHHAASPLGAGWLKNTLRRLHLVYVMRDAWWGLRGANTAEVQVLYEPTDGSLSVATWDRARREIARLASAARERGTLILYLALDLGRSTTLNEIVAASDLERVEVREALEGYDPELLYVSARDHHPSALQHRIIADVLLRALESGRALGAASGAADA